LRGRTVGRWFLANRNKKRAWFLASGTTLVTILFLLFASFPPFGAPTALASTTTLTILSGSAELQVGGSSDWQPGRDGTTLKAGDRVRTLADGHALITFFEGSTTELEPNTDLTIRTLEAASSSPATSIQLQQWLGTSWHRVMQLADPASRYEIETPVAVATVRGRNRALANY